MGYTGKLKEKQKAIKLRKLGFSYREIVKKVPVSKDTISRWCRDVKLTPIQIEKLIENKKNGLRMGSIIGAKANKTKRMNQEQCLLEEGSKQVGALSRRDKFLIGISLYMAEGSKTGSGVEFTNSDPNAIRFMVMWFQEFCQVSVEKLKCSLWLHDNLSENAAKNYWSSLLYISQNQFGKTYFAKNKINSPKVRKNIHQYGIIKIRFYDTFKLRLIKGWITGILTS